MAEEVEITNVGGDAGVASEATLRLLLKAFDNLAKGQGTDARKAKEAATKYHEELKNGIKIIKDETEARKENTEALEDATSKISAFARSTVGLLISGIGSIIGGVFNLGQELVLGGDRISDFARHIPIVGEYLAVLTQALDQTIDNFRSMTGSGIDFGGSLFNLRYQATQSGLSFETFTNVLRNNSESLALFAGSATAGARIFTQVSGIIQGKFGPQFSALGLTMEETAEYTADYLDLQRRLGRTQRMDQQQLAEGTRNYILMIDRLAKITGKRREQVEAELEQQRTDVVFAAFLSGLEDSVRQNVQEAMVGAPAELQQGLKDIFSSGGNLITSEAQDVAKAVSVAGGNITELQSIVQDISSGVKSEEALFEYINRLGAGITDQRRDELIKLQQSGEEYARMALALIGYQEANKGAAEANQEQIEAINRGSDALLDFERRITQFRNLIVGRLIESGAFQMFETAANDLINFLTGPQGLELLQYAIDGIASFFQNFITDVRQVGFKQALLNLVPDISAAISSIMSTVGANLISAVTAWWDDQSGFTKAMIIGATALFALGGPVAGAFTAGIAAMFASRAMIGAIGAALGAALSLPVLTAILALWPTAAGDGTITGPIDEQLEREGYDPGSPEWHAERERRIAEKNESMVTSAEDMANEYLNGLSAKIAAEQDKINRSLAGENVYWGREWKGREESEAEIRRLQDEFNRYQEQLEEARRMQQQQEQESASEPSTVTAPEVEKSVADLTSTVQQTTEAATQATTSSMQELNNTMVEVLAELRRLRIIDEKIEKNTSAIGGNIANGRASAIR